ncbi:uncharacterized protein K452DRAFT_298419 [Aplosporella prunicola CBS 121167]|uniref:Uncharacterized protein n=1 Tax=Aplosporella prunicola CBS 121167 TaxID=1176127 RepID=A0A6A6BED8_9PEZI|nr:uncharacterized protein K452DRAFT_298419 [Aplosporella prunicola CBS 121167]KAF2141753.1 hypothetical protein K452DRAFT_298419 [Aplosporella prunicola CBS 121167]
MSLKQAYPWIQEPLVASAPMRLIALAPLAVSVSLAGGIGFLAAGTDTTTLSDNLNSARSLLSKHHPPLQTAHPDLLPIGVGFITWGASLPAAFDILRKHPPSAVWLFAPRSPAELTEWATAARDATAGRTKVWVQVGSVAEAVEAVKACAPNVLVVQGTDAGGHGRARGAGIGALVPETVDAVDALASKENDRSGGAGMKPVIVAAGGITEARGAAAAFACGAQGVVLGTRFLACPEATLPEGYRDAVVRAVDGGQSTVRTGVYDELRGTTGWPPGYNGRGVVNRSFVDAEAGVVSLEENKRLYKAAVEGPGGGFGVEGRATTYAGAGVGLVRDVRPAGEVVRKLIPYAYSLDKAADAPLKWEGKSNFF